MCLVNQDVLAAATEMGTVTLDVADVDAVTRYYTEGVGLDVLSTGDGGLLLGRGRTPIVAIRHAPGLRHASSSAAGLYHTAIVFDTKAALATAVLSVAQRYPRSFTGSSDHIVSLAFYFDDVEGNGVELYWDRPRETWPRHDGDIGMGLLPLDPNAFLRDHLPAAPLADGSAQVGHVHLKVGDVGTAERFYVGTVGFEVTARYGPQALFVSAGGYHHHVGMNTWHSQGAGPRTPALGLGQVSFLVPDRDALGALHARLLAAKVAVRDDGAALSFEDPWSNAVRAAVAEPTA